MRFFRPTRPIGTGLGLFVVRSIITEHRGTIRIDSHPGQGTTVLIEFPLVERVATSERG